MSLFAFDEATVFFKYTATPDLDRIQPYMDIS